MGIAAAAILSIAVVAVLLASRDASLVTTDVTLDEIAGDPGLIDESVITRSYVDELLTGDAMTVTSDSGAEPVLVLLSPNALVNGSPPVPGGLSINLLREDDPVQLFGTVGSFERQAMAESFGLVLHEELFDAWEGAPVIVADQVETAPLASLDTVDEP